MRAVSALLLASLALPVMAGAEPSPPAAECLVAARAAEVRWGLPLGLLAAIGAVETGRRDPATGLSEPWPWSANARGTDYVFASAGEAGVVVDFLRERGIDSVDVGCFQVNLRAHPAAFASPRAGFDPQTNADYAARFLRALHDRSGSWVWAVGAYHSTDPGEGGPYRARVLAEWAARRRLPEPAAKAPIPVYTPATLPKSLRPAFARWLAPDGSPSGKQYLN